MIKLYRIVYNADTNNFVSCEEVGVITSPNGYVNYTQRVHEFFISYTQSRLGPEDAMNRAWKLMESWVSG